MVRVAVLSAPHGLPERLQRLAEVQLRAAHRSVGVSKSARLCCARLWLGTRPTSKVWRELGGSDARNISRSSAVLVTAFSTRRPRCWQPQ